MIEKKFNQAGRVLDSLGDTIFPGFASTEVESRRTVLKKILSGTILGGASVFNGGRLVGELINNYLNRGGIKIKEQIAKENVEVHLHFMKALKSFARCMNFTGKAILSDYGSVENIEEEDVVFIDDVGFTKHNKHEHVLVLLSNMTGILGRLELTSYKDSVIDGFLDGAFSDIELLTIRQFNEYAVELQEISSEILEKSFRANLIKEILLGKSQSSHNWDLSRTAVV